MSRSTVLQEITDIPAPRKPISSLLRWDNMSPSLNILPLFTTNRGIRAGDGLNTGILELVNTETYEVLDTLDFANDLGVNIRPSAFSCFDSIRASIYIVMYSSGDSGVKLAQITFIGDVITVTYPGAGGWLPASTFDVGGDAGSLAMFSHEIPALAFIDGSEFVFRAGLVEYRMNVTNGAFISGSTITLNSLDFDVALTSSYSSLYISEAGDFAIKQISAVSGEGQARSVDIYITDRGTSLATSTWYIVNSDLWGIYDRGVVAATGNLHVGMVGDSVFISGGIVFAQSSTGNDTLIMGPRVMERSDFDRYIRELLALKTGVVL